jgi:hypothetical protein
MSIVPCKEAFDYAFDVFTNKFFRGVDITGIVERREKGEGRREKGEGRREKGEGRREYRE